ncbi:MAG: hypothetical protein ABEK84_03365, partial [Salinibacter sp.]
MRRLLVGLCILGMWIPAVRGQTPAQEHVQNLRPGGLVSNTVRELATAGDSLWLGPLLTVYVESEDRFLVPDDPVVRRRLIEGNNVVFSLAATSASQARSTVWAGLAFDAGGDAIGAGGFLVSTDGGRSFEARPVPLDDPADTTITYGNSTLPAVPVTQEVGSAPQDLALGPRSGSVWVAGARSGLRHSTDRGRTWSRIVLPPDTSTRIEPSQSYEFLVAPPLGEGRGFQNYQALSVLVDETGTVWAGTLAGLNRSTPNDVGPAGDRAWRLFRPDGTPEGLPGQIVWALAEQPRPDGRNPIWMATLRARTDGPLQRTGVAMTPDGGKTFRQSLIGEQVNDLAARQRRVYAAAESGLFVTGNQGQTWRSIEDVALQDADAVFPRGLTARSVAVTPSALWVGT